MPLVSILLMERSSADASSGALHSFQLEVALLFGKYYTFLSVPMKQHLCRTIFPAVALRFGSLRLPIFSEFGKTLAAILFLFFNGTTDLDAQSKLLELMLTPLCAALTPCSLDDSLLQVCGDGVTGIAQSNPELFKAQVMALSPANRSVLQNAMRSAMLQKQKGSNTSQSSSTGSSEDRPAKKMDFSRYQKK
jgi:hypothetical protein